MSKSDISSRPRANLATTIAQKVYCQTDYPEIFSCTYWGQAPYTTYLHPPNIIRNRNKFIKDFKIKSSPDFHWPNGSMRAPLRKIGWYELNSQPYYTIWDH